MVQVDWDRIRAVKAVSLTDDEIEDLFPMVIGCDTEQVDNINNLRALIKLSQEMLQYKDNQVFKKKKKKNYNCWVLLFKKKFLIIFKFNLGGVFSIRM